MTMQLISTFTLTYPLSWTGQHKTGVHIASPATTLCNAQFSNFKMNGNIPILDDDWVIMKEEDWWKPQTDPKENEWHNINDTSPGKIYLKAADATNRAWAYSPNPATHYLDDEDVTIQADIFLNVVTNGKLFAGISYIIGDPTLHENNKNVYGCVVQIYNSLDGTQRWVNLYIKEHSNVVHNTSIEVPATDTNYRLKFERAGGQFTAWYEIVQPVNTNIYWHA